MQTLLAKHKLADTDGTGFVINFEFDANLAIIYYQFVYWVSVFAIATSSSKTMKPHTDARLETRFPRKGDEEDTQYLLILLFKLMLSEYLNLPLNYDVERCKVRKKGYAERSHFHYELSIPLSLCVNIPFISFSGSRRPRLNSGITTMKLSQ